MPSPNPLLERLQDLDRSSSEFPVQLADILLTKDCMDIVQTLKTQYLTNFVEDLDHVRALIAFTRTLLNTTAGPQYFQTHRSLVLSLSF